MSQSPQIVMIGHVQLCLADGKTLVDTDPSHNLALYHAAMAADWAEGKSPPSSLMPSAAAASKRPAAATPLTPAEARRLYRAYRRLAWEYARKLVVATCLLRFRVAWQEAGGVYRCVSRAIRFYRAARANHATA